jgi:peptidoglycan/xylan/chitin deacetylase (PgdA/CDA1 family)
MGTSLPARLRQRVRRTCLRPLKALGFFELVGKSPWRRSKLLILCYHGISLADEHRWRPELYMERADLQQRFESLARFGCSVLPLGEALHRLYRNDLPPKSVSITFDDGGYDFYQQALPLLRDFGYPATVYQTTYYCGTGIPVFGPVCSYILWKRRGTILPGKTELGLDTELDLRTESSRQAVVSQLVSYTARKEMNGAERHQISRMLAQHVGVDYDALLGSRILQLMKADEIREAMRQGIDFQLHTHRHRTPDDKVLFLKEIDDNRRWLEAVTQSAAVHFCYPSGVYKSQFLPWLVEKGVVSATTCDWGLVSQDCSPLLLPRFVDSSLRTVIEFESWLSGIGAVMAYKSRRAVLVTSNLDECRHLQSPASTR